jgi:hypothetical protein
MQTQQENDKAKPVKEKKDKPKKTEKVVEKSEDEIRAEVSAVMEQEVKLWPKEVLQFLGKSSPNPHGFVNGVPYAIRAYMNVTRKNVLEVLAKKRRVAELEVAQRLSDVTKEINPLMSEFRAKKQDDIKELEERRKGALRAAQEEINHRFNMERASIESRLPEERLKELMMEEAEVKAAWEKESQDIENSFNPILAKIQFIEENAENWDSKKRQAKRKAISKEETDTDA